jgi:MFS family permease
MAIRTDTLPSTHARGSSPILVLLRLRNFRLWYLGQLVSLTGSWMQTTAQGYYLYELTHSRADLGMLGFASGLPNLLFLLWGGIIADRFPRRRILFITQGTMMGISLLLTLLVFFHLARPWHFFLLAFALGVANAMDVPARQAFLIEIIDRRYLTEAVALNSSLFQGSMALGPLLGGFVYHHFGPGWCFLANTLSFLAILLAFLLMDPLPPSPSHSKKNLSALQEMRDALNFVLKTETIRKTLLLVGGMSILVMSFVALMPAWARDILKGDARTLGYLHFSRALGALGGVLFIALSASRVSRERLMQISLLLLPLLLWGFTLARIPFLSYFLLTGAGAFMVTTINLSNSFVQLQVPDSLRGRAMSLFSLTFFGGIPVGSLLLGGIAEYFGLQSALFFSTLSSTLMAIIFIPIIRNGFSRNSPPTFPPESM